MQARVMPIVLASSLALACGGGTPSSTPAADAAVPETSAGPAERDASAPTPDAAQGADAQSVDVLAPDATHEDADAMPQTCASLPLCDDFESAPVGGSPSAALWSIVSPDCSGSGTLSIDGTQAHSGQHSVKVVGGGGYCDHVFFANTTAIRAVAPQVYLRFFVRVGDALGSGHVTIVAMKDSADGNKDVRIGGQDSIIIYNRQSDDATLPVLSPAGTAMSVALAVQTWTCVEVHIDETAGTIETWVDGKAIAGLAETGAPVADVSTQWLAHGAWNPSLADLRFGWESYAGQAMTLWLDDVAVRAVRLGCEP